MSSRLVPAADDVGGPSACSPLPSSCEVHRDVRREQPGPPFHALSRDRDRGISRIAAVLEPHGRQARIVGEAQASISTSRTGPVNRQKHGPGTSRVQQAACGEHADWVWWSVR